MGEEAGSAVVRADAIASASLCRALPRTQHFYVWGFVPVYALAVWLAVSHYQSESTGFAWTAALVLAGGLAANALAFVATFWNVRIARWFAHRKCTCVEDADHVMVIPKEHHGSPAIVPIRFTEGKHPRRFIVADHLRYVWLDDERVFALPSPPSAHRAGHYLSAQGNNVDDVHALVEQFGSNDIAIPLPSFGDMLAQQAVAPFFVFQMFCVVLWMLDEYWYYSLLTLVMLVMFECTVVKQRQSNLQRLRAMAPPPCTVSVFRDDKWQMLPSSSLVPNDLVSLGAFRNRSGAVRDGWACPCDVVVVHGSCYVNEAMLTGESVPQMKLSLEAIGDADVNLDVNSHKRHIILAGTNIVQHSNPKPSSDSGKSSPHFPKDGGCVGYVIRAGFYTEKGSLLRTMLCSVDRATANNAEAFRFIAILVVLAIAAAAYTLVHGLADEGRSRYKLMLNCVMIITSVIPPELPMELSLAVNHSLISLARSGVYCTEPFRIPVGGRVDVCCFDKTGTLTSDELVVKGIAGAVREAGKENALDLAAPLLEPPCAQGGMALAVLAGCHSLVRLGRDLTGNPLELAAQEAIGFSVSSDGTVMKTKRHEIHVLRQFAFSSDLKRMATVCKVQAQGETSICALCKGAPEVIASRLAVVPQNYDACYQRYARQGFRVIALAHKTIAGQVGAAEMRELVRGLERGQLEKDLEFCGFLVLHCPMKPTTPPVVASLQQSSHDVVIITGDQALTACFVAKELGLSDKPFLVLSVEGEGALLWKAVDGSATLPFDAQKLPPSPDHALCVTGQGLAMVLEQGHLERLSEFVSVYARVSPAHKQHIITSIQKSGRCAMMCGDGTNDVGALKHSDVGVALLAHPTERRPTNPKPFDMEEEAAMPELGDASIASAFTSHRNTIECTEALVRQGRCTLVTTQQMYKILAVNCVMTAYSYSVLFSDGIKLGDTQMTITAVFTAAMFFLISRAKPLKALSPKRPHSSIFALYTLVSVGGQLVVNLLCLLKCVALATAHLPSDTVMEVDGDFSPNVINTAVFYVFLANQIGTFAINYNGHPFMESLREHKSLYRALAVSAALCVALVLEVVPDLNELLELASIKDDQTRWHIVFVLVGSWLGCWASERVAQAFFGSRARVSKMVVAHKAKRD